MPHIKLALLILTTFGALACGESRNQVGKNNPDGATGSAGNVTGSGGGNGTAGSGGQASSSGAPGSGGVAGTPVTTGIGTGGVGAGGAGGAIASKGGTTAAGASGSRTGGSSGGRDAGAGDRPSDTPRDSGVCPDGWMWCTDCTGSGSCGPTCTGYVCPEFDAGSPVDATSGACSKLATQSACEARRDCHTIFADATTCACATPGCCMRFSRCTDGQPDCTKPAQPSCAVPEMLCPSPYQVSYRGGCPSGCVLASACPRVADGGQEAGAFTCAVVSGDYRTCVLQLQAKLDEAQACTPGAANQCSQRISDGCCPRAVNNASAPAVACYLEVRAQSSACSSCSPEPCPTVLGECQAEDGGIAKCR